MTTAPDLTDVARACYDVWARRMDRRWPLTSPASDGRGARYKPRSRWDLLSHEIQECWREVAATALEYAR